MAAMAALDLGTNNCRLLVARARDPGFEVLESFSRIVRLGEGVATTGRLSAAAEERTLQALRICARIMARRRVGPTRCVATAACRRADNGPAFLERVERTTGLAFEILDGAEESRLALLGCLPLVEDRARHVLVLDIGGGSTELAWLDRAGARPVLAHSISLPIGVVGLAEQFGEVVDDAAYAAMVASVSARLEPLACDLPRLDWAAPEVQMIGTSGTVTTLAALHLGLERYERRRVDGVEVVFEALRPVATRLRGMTLAEREAHRCIGPGRADLVVAGSAILEAAHALWPVPRLRVADRGLREGILHELARADLDPAPSLALSA